MSPAAFLIGKLFSALRSAAGKNFSSVSGRHSLAEPVLHLAMTLFRLISPFQIHNPHSIGSPYETTPTPQNGRRDIEQQSINPLQGSIIYHEEAICQPFFVNSAAHRLFSGGALKKFVHFIKIIFSITQNVKIIS